MSAMQLRRIEPEEVVVSLVPMRRRHLRSVLRIEAHAQHRPWSLGLFMSELALRNSRLYVVAKVGSEVVGFGGMLFSAGDAHVTTLSVDPEWRRVGVATRIMLLMTRRAVEAGATNLTLEVRAGNTEAQGLYRAFGLAPAGVRKNYYSDIGEDALIMWAHDIDGAAYEARLDDIARQVPGATQFEGWT